MLTGLWDALHICLTPGSHAWVMRSFLACAFLVLFSLQASAEVDCPSHGKDEIIVATFNVYKLGSVADKYKRNDVGAEVPERIGNLAQVLAAGKFDLIALQEVTAGRQGQAALADLVAQLRDIHGLEYKFLLSDCVGQWYMRDKELMREAMAFLYDPAKVKPESIPGTGGLTQIINTAGRDMVRTQWEAGDFDFTLICVHLVWGSKRYRDAGYQKIKQIFSQPTPSPFSNDPDIIVLGDFNRFGKGYDSVKILEFDGSFFAPNIVIFDPDFNTRPQVTKEAVSGKNIPGDNPQWLSTTVAANRYVYDMILFSPDVAEEYSAGTKHGAFASDFGILPFDEKGGCGHLAGLEKMGHRALSEAVSDHRPLWMRFKTNTGNADDGPP